MATGCASEPLQAERRVHKRIGDRHTVLPAGANSGNRRQQLLTWRKRASTVASSAHADAFLGDGWLAWR